MNKNYAFLFFAVLLSFTSCKEKESILTVAPPREPVDNSGDLIYRMATMGGVGTSGLLNGLAAEAKFNTPVGCFVNAKGEVLIADQQNHVIRKIDVSYNVTTIAGAGTAGNAVGASGQFNRPYDVVEDSKGNLFVADYANHQIRKVNASGEISIFVGGTAGLVNGTGTAARVRNPFSLAIDANDNLYLSDHGNHVVRKITPDAVVTTVAGIGTKGKVNSTALLSSFDGPTGISIDRTGNIYVAEYYTNTIRKIGVDGNVTTVGGDGSKGFVDGDVLTSKFNQPYDVTVDQDGNLFVADYSNHRIRKINAAGTLVTTIAGTGVQGFSAGVALESTIRFPSGISAGKNGEIIFIDRNNHAVRRLIPEK